MKKFIKLSYEMWNNWEIKNLSHSGLKILIELLFLRYKFNNDSFFQSSDEIFQNFNVSRMSWHRVQDELRSLHIQITYTNKKYEFDLSDFIELYDG